jgi:hypothetical protein
VTVNNHYGPVTQKNLLIRTSHVANLYDFLTRTVSERLPVSLGERPSALLKWIVRRNKMWKSEMRNSKTENWQCGFESKRLATADS